MSRSGYVDYSADGNNGINLYRATVRRTINGKNGQALSPRRSANQPREA